MTAPDTWNDERVGLLKKLWSDGLSSRQIASELGNGITRNAVLGKAHRLKLPERKAKEPQRHILPSGIGTMELDSPSSPHMCRWIDGDPKQPPVTYCGKPTDGGPWCEEHKPRTWRKNPGDNGVDA
jgi:GcrA cell cycle regulator